VLLVPNAALRFTPPVAVGPKAEGSFVSSLMPRPPAEPQKPNGKVEGGAQQVWVQTENGPHAVPVKTGVSNGRLTEIIGGELKAGMAVITDFTEAKK
jgi:HlyD family secretion protein